LLPALKSSLRTRLYPDAPAPVDVPASVKEKLAVPADHRLALAPATAAPL